METGSRPIPNMLRRHRKVLGYSQKQVARLLELKDAQHISMWEKGKKLPNSLNLLKLSLVYRTYPNALYDELLQTLKDSITQKEIELFQQQ